jgi:hypothetical protein
MRSPSTGWRPGNLPIEDIDWHYRGEYIRTRSRRRPGDFDVEPEWATEAASDENRKIAAPDPSSKTGQTIRVLGYSQAVNRVLVVILRPKNLPDVDGSWWGVNAWAASSTAMRRYQE